MFERAAAEEELSGSTLESSCQGCGAGSDELNSGSRIPQIFGARWLVNLWWMFAAACVGILFALSVVKIGVDSTVDSQAYVRRPDYSVWSGLVLLQVPVWAVLGVVCQSWDTEIRDAYEHKAPSSKLRLCAWIGTAIVLGALFLAQTFAMELPYDRSYPDYLSARTFTMGAIVAAVAAVPAVSLWGLSRAAQAEAGDPVTADAAIHFRLLWLRQGDYLVCLGLILTLTVLTTAAKFHANNTFDPPTRSPLPNVPPTFILVQGAWYVAIMLAIFVPPYLATRKAGYGLVEKLTGMTHPISSGSPSLHQLIERRKTEEQYRTLIGLSATGRQQLERAMVVCAPLIAATLTTLLP
jgi:hypothetical protein